MGFMVFVVVIVLYSAKFIPKLSLIWLRFVLFFLKPFSFIFPSFLIRYLYMVADFIRRYSSDFCFSFHWSLFPFPLFFAPIIWFWFSNTLWSRICLVLCAHAKMKKKGNKWKRKSYKTTKRKTENETIWSTSSNSERAKFENSLNWEIANRMQIKQYNVFKCSKWIRWIYYIQISIEASVWPRRA